MDTATKDYEDIGTIIWDEMADVKIEFSRMARIIAEMNAFQKDNKNVHKPLKEWISKLVDLTELVNTKFLPLRDSCQKVSHVVGKLHHIAVGHAELSMRAMENSVLFPPAACSSPKAPQLLDKKRMKIPCEVAADQDPGRWSEPTRKKKPRARKHDAAKANVKLPPPPCPRRTQQLKRVRVKPDAILIKAARTEGDDPTTSYATIVARLKEKVDLTTIGVTIEKTRMTKAGDLLLEVDGNEPAPTALSGAIMAALGDLGEATVLQQKVAVEFRGVDVTATEEDVRNALRIRSGEEPFRIGRMRRSPGGQINVDAVLSRRVAGTLLVEGRFKIGWSTCKVRLKERSNRCFRCQGFGHYAATCNGPDRRKICMRCGEEGHIAVKCNKKPACPLCSDNGFETNHVSGDEACDSRKKAINK